MERLTKRLNDGKALCIGVCEKECVEGYSECHKCKPFVDVVKKLTDYEDAEDKGLLLRLPCKVGDTVYKLWYANDKPYKVQELKIRTLSLVVAMMEDGLFGKKVFHTKEEAEKALKQTGE